MTNRLSEQLQQDFLTQDVLALPLEQQQGRLYEMSYDYLIELIEKVKELEEKNEHS